MRHIPFGRVVRTIGPFWRNRITIARVRAGDRSGMQRIVAV
jgi:hypothetical protein